MPVTIYPKNSCESRAPPDPPGPRDRAKSHPHSSPRERATAPSPTHPVALAIPGERTGVAAKLGKRRFFKVALPETASNHYISFWLSGRALDSGQAEHQFISPFLRFLLFFSLFILLYVSSNPVFLLFIFIFFRLYCCTYEDCCCTVVHTWWVRGLEVEEFFCCAL